MPVSSARVSLTAMVVVRTDLDGTPRAGAGTWRLVAIAEPARDAAAGRGAAPPEREAMVTTPGDRLRPRWDQGEAVEVVLHGWSDGGEKARGDALARRER